MVNRSIAKDYFLNQKTKKLEEETGIQINVIPLQKTDKFWSKVLMKDEFYEYVNNQPFINLIIDESSNKVSIIHMANQNFYNLVPKEKVDIIIKNDANDNLEDLQWGNSEHRLMFNLRKTIDKLALEMGAYKKVISTPLEVMQIRKHSAGNFQLVVGKFGCVRSDNSSICSHSNPKYVYDGKNKKHQGVDLLAPEGTTIYSCVDGTAYVYSGEVPGYGKVISVKGKLKNRYTGVEEDVYVIYGHLSEYSVENGDTVKIGDILGESGKSGNGDTRVLSERHLHLDISTAKWPVKGFKNRKDPWTYNKKSDNFSKTYATYFSLLNSSSISTGVL